LSLLAADAVYFGEVSLSGAIRPVAHAASRLKEAAKLGFTRAVVPEATRTEAGEPSLKVTDVASLASLVADIAALGKPRNSGKTRGQDG
jgi:DNA repair protein RadA/Sms